MPHGMMLRKVTKTLPLDEARRQNAAAEQGERERVMAGARAQMMRQPPRRQESMRAVPRVPFRQYPAVFLTGMREAMGVGGPRPTFPIPGGEAYPAGRTGLTEDPAEFARNLGQAAGTVVSPLGLAFQTPIMGQIGSGVKRLAGRVMPSLRGAAQRVGGAVRDYAAHGPMGARRALGQTFGQVGAQVTPRGMGPVSRPLPQAGQGVARPPGLSAEEQALMNRWEAGLPTRQRELLGALRDPGSRQSVGLREDLLRSQRGGPRPAPVTARPRGGGGQMVPSRPGEPQERAIFKMGEPRREAARASLRAATERVAAHGPRVGVPAPLRESRTLPVGPRGAAPVAPRITPRVPGAQPPFYRSFPPGAPRPASPRGAAPTVTRHVQGPPTAGQSWPLVPQRPVAPPPRAYPSHRPGRAPVPEAGATVPRGRPKTVTFDQYAREVLGPRGPAPRGPMGPRGPAPRLEPSPHQGMLWDRRAGTVIDQRTGKVYPATKDGYPMIEGITPGEFGSAESAPGPATQSPPYGGRRR